MVQNPHQERNHAMMAGRRPPHRRCPPGAPTVLAFGETLVERRRDRNVPGGSPFNVACHLAALGAHPVLVTRAGKDAPGDALVRAMGARGLDLRGLQRDPARPTGQVAGADGIPPDQACDHIHPGLARMVGLSAHPDLVYFGTGAHRGASRRALRELLATVGCGVFLDLDLDAPWVDVDTLRWSLRRADVVKLGEDALMRIAALLALDGATPRICAALLMAAYDLGGLVVTRGTGGAWTLDATGGVESVAGEAPPQVVDPAGAGDGFAAVFMLGLLRGWPLAETLTRADAFARALCGVSGALPAPPDFYAPFVRDWQLERETRA